jgi:hypothetical protein
MIRLTEFLLLFAPLAAFVAWRVWAPGKVPPVGMIVVMGAALAILAGGLVWLRFQDTAPPGSIYIPSHIENGRIVPERHTP